MFKRDLISRDGFCKSLSMKLAPIVHFLILITFLGCNEEVNRPAFQMHDVSDLNDEGVTFNGKISIIGDDQVTNYGFVWASHSEPLLSDSAYSFNSSPTPGNFSIRVTDDLITNTEYYARAFVRTSRETFYSNKVKFKSLGSATPVITDFEPKHGASNEKIIIVGQHFTENIKNIEVFVGTLQCKVLSAARNELQIELPASYVTGSYPISVKINDKTALAPANFLLDGPTIESINPMSGPGQTLVTVSGQGFSEILEENVIYFGTAKVRPISSSTTQLSFLAPQLSIAGDYEISVGLDKTTAISPVLFKLTGPTITLISPLSGVQGAEVIITGEGFSNVPEENEVTFGFYPNGEVISASSNKLVVLVPRMTSPGPVPVSVRVKNIYASYNQQFIIEGPEVFSISPTAQYSGREVSISGKNFGTVENTRVFFAGKEAVVLEHSPTSMTVEVPYDHFNSSPVTIWVGPMKYESPQVLQILSPWQKLSDFPGVKRYGATSFTLDGYGYVCMGYSSGQNLRDVWRFDPANHSWTRMKDHPGPIRSYAFSFVVNGKAYVGGGGHSTGSGNSVNYYDLWEYDPANDTWTEKRGFSPNGITNARLSATNVGQYGCFVYNNRLYRYDTMLDSWTTTSSYPYAQSGSIAAATVGDKGYFGLGGSGRTFWEYSPPSNSWTQLPDFPGISTAYPHQFVFGNKLYIGNSTNFYEFDVVSKKWTQVAGMPETAIYVSMFTIGDRGYVVTGGNGGPLGIFYSFSPDY